MTRTIRPEDAWREIAEMRQEIAALQRLVRPSELITDMRLPENPYPDQEITVQVALGTIWRFRYNADSPSLQWESIGSSKWEAGPTNPGVQTTTGTFQDLSGPTITVPFAGEYTVEGEATVNDPSNLLVLTRVHLGNTASAFTRFSAPSYNGATPVKQARLTTLEAGVLAKMQFYTSVAQNVSFGWTDAYVRLTPLRVGQPS